ncbi:GtrA family protein, partial [Halieaceae bacterium]|nr:GtrA family protein [Halieaceae bacterium]
MLRHFLSWQFLGFIAVGVTAALLHWLARIVLSTWLPFSSAVLLAYGVGMAVAFILNSLYVFPDSTEPRNVQVRRFVVINLGFLPVVWACSLLFLRLLEWLGMPAYREALAHGMAIA